MMYLKQRLSTNMSMFYLYLALFMIVFYFCTVAKCAVFFFSLMCFTQLKRNPQKKNKLNTFKKINDFRKTARCKQTIQLMWINSGYLRSETAWQRSSRWCPE